MEDVMELKKWIKPINQCIKRKTSQYVSNGCNTYETYKCELCTKANDNKVLMKTDCKVCKKCIINWAVGSIYMDKYWNKASCYKYTYQHDLTIREEIEMLIALRDALKFEIENEK